MQATRGAKTRAAMAAAVVGLTAGAAASVPAVAQEPNFGRALVMTATELFVGQPVNWYGAGAVYTYVREGGGWRERAMLVASDSSRMDDFGRSLAVDGNTLVAGAPRKGDNGVVYVFERPSATGAWRQVARLEPPPAGAAGASNRPVEFGAALVLAGDELLIGAPGGAGQGTVYRYRRGASGWAVAGTVQAPAGAAAFGAALSRDGDWLLVGAPASDEEAGRAWLFRRGASGDWGTPTPATPPRIAGPEAGLGAAVMLTSDRAYIGAPDGGAVVVLERGANGTLTMLGSLRPFEASRGTGFGHALAMAGNELWVGAPGLNGSNGAIYRFLPDSRGGFGGALRLDADSTDGTAWPFAFGYAIATADGRAAVAMPSRDFGEGRVLTLNREGQTWTEHGLLEGRIFRPGQALEAGARCDDGKIAEFPCTNLQLVSHMPTAALGGARGAWVNDVWGWTDPATGRDYALVARRDGASFVDVTDPASPRLIGTLDRTKGAPPSVWRDIKVIGTHAFIVADGAGAHGMQVFDLTRLRAVTDTPAVFTPDTTYHEIHSAHNVVADTSSGFVFVVGASSGGRTCGGGLHMVDVRDPKNPKFAGCYNDRSGANPRGYTHDAQCLVYEGPDARYRGRQICIGSNEREINIADVTDKANPVTIGRSSYPNVAYAHQGWFDAEQRYFYMNDEGDELAGTVGGTRTIVWDLSRLDDPVIAREYVGPVMASDHNLYVRGNYVFESNYGSGLRVLDISDRTNPKEVAFFDSAPYNDNGPGHSAAQSGAWSNYPFFKSGIIVFTSVREGLFIVRLTNTPPIS